MWFLRHHLSIRLEAHMKDMSLTIQFFGLLLNVFDTITKQFKMVHPLKIANLLKEKTGHTHTFIIHVFITKGLQNNHTSPKFTSSCFSASSSASLSSPSISTANVLEREPSLSEHTVQTHTQTTNKKLLSNEAITEVITSS